MRDRGALGGGGLLTVDRGNSTLDLRAQPSPGVPALRIRLPVDAREELAAWIDARGVERCIAASVIPGGLDVLVALLGARGIPVTVAGKDVACPLRVQYDDPRELGVDRWLAALAAKNSRGTALVVDCGTATTFGLVRSDGAFFPGPIAPGLDALAFGLAARAPGLPRVEIEGRWVFPPRGTRDAVTAGVILGAATMIDGILSRLIAVFLDERIIECDPPVFLTGGRADRVAPQLQRRVELAPDLVHDGLAWLATRSD